MKVGAASKGIIQREYQHHATVYKQAYAKVNNTCITPHSLQAGLHKGNQYTYHSTVYN